MSDELSDSALTGLAAAVLERLREDGRMLATAESCTGGLIAGFLTGVSGSSDVLDRGFVTYSNEAKAAMLGVPEAMIATHGAVSEPVAEAMALGALANSRASVALSVTGVAGPGQSERKPAGLVFIGLAVQRTDRTGNQPSVKVSENHFPGDRRAVRLASVRAALSMALTV